MLSQVGIQVVSRGKVIWARKPMWLRNIPYTAVAPHRGQYEVRKRFAEIAKKAKGEKGIKMTDIGPLTPAAARIHEELKGYTAPHRMSPEEYPSRKQRTFHTVESLELYAKRRGWVE